MYSQKLRLISFLIVSLWSIYSYSNSCDYYFKRADSLARLNLWTESIQFFRHALRCYDEEENRESWFNCIWRIDSIYTKCDFEGNRSLTVAHINAAKFLEELIQKTSYDFQPQNYLSWIWVHVRAGFHFKQIYDYNKALTYFNKALFLDEIGCNKSGVIEFPCFERIHILESVLFLKNRILHEIGDDETVLQILSDEIINDLKAKKESNSPKILADFFIQKGISHFSLGDTIGSIDAYLTAWNLPGLKTGMKAIILNNLGLIKSDVKLLEDSENLLKMNSEDSILLSDNYLFRGYIARDNGDYTEAIENANTALSYFAPHHNQEAKSYPFFLLAEAYDSLSFYNSAEEYYHKTLQAISPNFRDSEKGTLPSFQHLVSDKNFAEALNGLAKIWITYGNDRKDTIYLSKALVAYKLAILIDDQLSNNSLAESTKAKYAADRNQISSVALSLVFDLWNESKADSLLDWAFFFMEKSRARELYGQLDQQRLYDSFPKLDTLSKEINLTKLGILELERRMNIDSILEIENLIKEKETELIGLNIHLDNLARESRIHGYLQSNQEESLSLSSFQNQLDRHRGFIHFAEGDKAFFALGITKDNSYFFKIPKDSVLREKIRFAKAFNKDESPSPKERIRYQRESFELYNSLLAHFTENIPENINKLVISVPTSSLYDFPFESLVIDAYPENKLRDFNKLSYLWQRFELSRAYSASLYLYDSQTKGSPQFAYTGFAPTAKGLVDNPPLIFHVEEVNQSGSIFQSLKKAFQTFLNGNATKEAFFNIAEDAEILHLAMHSFNIEDGTNTPYLQFSWNGKESSSNHHNNRLYLYELYPLALNSRLVIISACNSGQGEYITGEGINHFGRGFRLAGASNALISLWQLNDKASSELVPDFLRYLQEGKSKSEALKLARRDFFNDQNKTNEQLAPYFWANLVLEADAYPIYKRASYIHIYWILGVLLGILILAIIYGRFRLANES